jgi:uncharacterized protein YoxC
LRKLIPIAAAIALALLIIGCGGGEDTMTKTGFVNEAKAVCEATRQQMKERLEKSSNLLHFSILAMKREIREIGALNPPRKEVKPVGEMLDHLKRSIAAYGIQIENFHHANGELKKAEKIADEIGLAPSCLLI